MNDWLPIRQRIHFKIFSFVRNCHTVSAPQYPKAYCIPISSVASLSTLRCSALATWSSVVGHEHLINYYSVYRGFAIRGPSNRNKLPQPLGDPFLISSGHSPSQSNLHPP